MIEIVIGFVSGIVTATGMGGGTILILCLFMFLGENQHVAQATNLVFFIPTSLIAIYINMKNKLIDYKLVSVIIISGIIGAVIGAKISNKMDVITLKKYFGIFLIVIAVSEIFWMLFDNKKAKTNFRK